MDEERLASQSLVDNLMIKFGTKPIVKENQVKSLEYLKHYCRVNLDRRIVKKNKVGEK